MKSSNIGGQAVLEGIMMKNRDRYAVAVRKPDPETIYVHVQIITRKNILHLMLFLSDTLEKLM